VRANAAASRRTVIGHVSRWAKTPALTWVLLACCSGSSLAGNGVYEDDEAVSADQAWDEVVGQMLDYAANAVVYWPVERLRSYFEAGCEADG